MDDAKGEEAEPNRNDNESGEEEEKVKIQRREKRMGWRQFVTIVLGWAESITKKEMKETENKEEKKAEEMDGISLLLKKANENKDGQRGRKGKWREKEKENDER